MNGKKLCFVRNNKKNLMNLMPKVLTHFISSNLKIKPDNNISEKKPSFVSIIFFE